MKVDHQKVESLITSVVTAMGMSIWNVEICKLKRKTLVRVYIDPPLGDGRRSISVDDCGRISSQIGALLDVECPSLANYVLEVSSPGIGRSLKKLEHYQRYIGSVIRIVLRHPQNGKYDFIGKIQEVFDNTLKLVVSGEVFTFLLTDISKANLVSAF